MASIDARKDALFVTTIRPFRADSKPPAPATMSRVPGGSLVSAPLGGGSGEVLIGRDGAMAVRRLDAGGKLVFERKIGETSSR